VRVLSIGKWSRFASASVIASVALCLLVLTAPSVRAANPDLTVYGYVYDTEGSPVNGATVLIVIVESGHSRYGTTDSDGLYTSATDFNATDYALDNTIRVTASYDSSVAQNETVVTAGIVSVGVAQVDVHFTYEIPEFGSLLGTVVAMVGIALVSAVALSRRRRA